MKLYLATYCTLTVFAFALIVINRRSCILLQPDYRRFLAVRWKVVTFLLGAVGTSIIAPYTGDPTWDYYDAFFMSTFTFLSAPWAIGIFWKALRRQCRWWELYCAVCLGLFSASWSYDLYILLRDGSYTPMWRENLYASSFLYLLAGLFWNLEWRTGRGATFAFFHAGWPSAPEKHPIGRIIWYILPVSLVVAWLFIEFVIRNNG
ncbi:hypothetical protein [Geomesophilobacter sediminis]|uniref:Uncharacterized protein n=1 Tax=Geomesophilobacter sediminis TaxID=2798584 RepID=A0A8J7LVP9_9BACT|nr:hypothetical protein [Geomesophilobacter sediminis]MBJ6725260.1 hypothetical protein [Geomesophilobacter sediminis]